VKEVTASLTEDICDLRVARTRPIRVGVTVSCPESRVGPRWRRSAARTSSGSVPHHVNVAGDARRAFRVRNWRFCGWPGPPRVGASDGKAFQPKRALRGQAGFSPVPVILISGAPAPAATVEFPARKFDEYRGVSSVVDAIPVRDLSHAHAVQAGRAVPARSPGSQSRPPQLPRKCMGNPRGVSRQFAKFHPIRRGRETMVATGGVQPRSVGGNQYICAQQSPVAWFAEPTQAPRDPCPSSLSSNNGTVEIL